ncbi:MAG: CDP-alcohol phosphatidyltransferase family protein [Pseudomonadota bacterium]|nr:CDP-alcohol phosphatidyltransferase family protein [Pseudomonadota bacterium]
MTDALGSAARRSFPALWLVTVLELALTGLVLTWLLWFLVQDGVLLKGSARWSLVAYWAVAGIVLMGIPAHRPHDRFGWGNRITLLRAVLLCLIAGAAFLPRSGSWWLVLGSTLFLVLDGFDGYAARRSGTTSRFGARFDMEMDALFALVAGFLIWRMDKTGAWILLSGFLRYGFVAFGYVLPRLRRPLPPSRFRGTLAMINAGILTGCMAPIIGPLVATVAALIGLVLVVCSFARDTYGLLTRPLATAPSGATGRL